MTRKCGGRLKPKLVSGITCDAFNTVGETRLILDPASWLLSIPICDSSATLLGVASYDVGLLSRFTLFGCI